MISNHLRSNISNIKGANRLGNPRNSIAWSEFELNLQFTVSIPVYLLAWLMTVNRINWKFDLTLTADSTGAVKSELSVSWKLINMLNLGQTFLSDYFKRAFTAQFIFARYSDSASANKKISTFGFDFDFSLDTGTGWQQEIFQLNPCAGMKG